MSTTTYATADLGDAPEHARTTRLGLALAGSVLFHVVAALLVIWLLPRILVPMHSHLATPAPIQVALVNVAPIAFAPPPESPAPAAELPPALPRPEEPPPPPSIPKATPEPAHAIPALPPKPAVPMATLGVSVQADTAGDVLADDLPPPPGDIAVGTTQKPDRIGGTQALRLAQKFSSTVSRAPRLRDPLIVAYPPGPARAHLEARIAVLVLIDAAGNITETTLFPDEAQFGPSITRALKNARMLPAEIDGRPVDYWTILEFVFTMRRPAVARQQ